MRIVHLQAAAVDHIDSAGDFFDKPGNLGDIVLSGRGLAGADGPDGLVANDHLGLVHALQTNFQLLFQHCIPPIQLGILLADAVEHLHTGVHSQPDLLVQDAVDGLGVRHAGFCQNAHLVIALFAVADDGVHHSHGLHGRNGTIGGEGAEVAAHRRIHPVNPLASYLYRTAFLPGRHGPQQMGLREVLDKFHLRRVVVFQRLLGIFHNISAPAFNGSNAVDAAQGRRHVKAFQIQKNVLH